MTKAYSRSPRWLYTSPSEIILRSQFQIFKYGKASHVHNDYHLLIFDSFNHIFFQYHFPHPRGTSAWDIRVGWRHMSVKTIRPNLSKMTKPHPASCFAQYSCTSAYCDNLLFGIFLPSPSLYATTPESTAHTPAMTVNYDLLACRVTSHHFIPAHRKAPCSTTLNHITTCFCAVPLAIPPHVSKMFLNYNSAIGSQGTRWR